MTDQQPTLVKGQKFEYLSLEDCSTAAIVAEKKDNKYIVKIIVKGQNVFIELSENEAEQLVSAQIMSNTQNVFTADIYGKKETIPLSAEERGRKSLRKEVAEPTQIILWPAQIKEIICAKLDNSGLRIRTQLHMEGIDIWNVLLNTIKNAIISAGVEQNEEA